MPPKKGGAPGGADQVSKHKAAPGKVPLPPPPPPAAPASAKKTNGRNSNGGGGVRETKAHPPPTPLATAGAPPAPAAPAKKEATALAAATKNKNKNKATSSHTTSRKSFSDPVADWMHTGLLLQAVGKSPVLNKFITDLSKDYYGQVLLQVHGSEDEDFKSVLVQHATNRCMAGAVGANTAGNYGSSKNSSSSSSKKVLTGKTNGATAASSSSNNRKNSSSVGSSTPLLTWSNTHTSLLKDPVNGAWEACKLYAPPLGPASLVSSINFSPEATDTYTKLHILANYKAFSPLLNLDVTSNAANLAQEWVSSMEWMKKEGRKKFDEALTTLTALLEGMAQVYPSVRHALPPTLAALQAIKAAKEGGKEGGKDGGKEEGKKAALLTDDVVRELIQARLSPLLNEGWAGGRAGSKARVHSAAAAVAALQTAMDGEGAEVGDVVRVLKKQGEEAIVEEEKLEKHKEKEESQATTEAADGTAAAAAEKARSEEKTLEGDRDDKERWEAHLKYHPGLREPVVAQVLGFRQHLKDGRARDIIREVLRTFQDHQRGTSPLLPVEIHTLQENLAMAAVVLGNPTLALSAIQKALPGNASSSSSSSCSGSDDSPSLPPCFSYCPSALRVKVLALESKGEEPKSKGAKEGGKERDLAAGHPTYAALNALEGMKEGDTLKEDSARRVTYLTTLAVYLYHQLKRLGGGGEDGREGGVIQTAVKQGLGYLKEAVGMFGKEEGEEEGEEENGIEGEVDKKWVRLSRKGEPMLWIQTNRLLAVFYAEDCLSPFLPQHFDLSIEAYQVSLHHAALLLQRVPKKQIPEVNSLINTLRFELARGYARRKKDETDEMACFTLLSQAEAALLHTQKEELGRLLHFEGTLWEEKGRRQRGREGGEEELRKAVGTYEKALEAFEGARTGGREGGEEAKVAHLVGLYKSVGSIYMALVERREEGEEGRPSAAAAPAAEGEERSSPPATSPRTTTAEAAVTAATATTAANTPPTLSPAEQAIRNADLEKAINKFTRAYALLSKYMEAGGKTSFEAGQVAFAIGDLYLKRKKEKRAKNLESGIGWFEKAEMGIRKSASDRTDAAGRYLPLYTQLWGKLSVMWRERAGLRKKEGGGEKKVKEDLEKSEKYGLLYQNARRNYEKRTEALMAGKMEQLNLGDEGKEMGEGGKREEGD